MAKATAKAKAMAATATLLMKRAKEAVNVAKRTKVLRGAFKMAKEKKREWASLQTLWRT